MIVWSRGLGKQRLRLALPDATLHVKPEMLTMEGEIERVCWNYCIKLAPVDLADFLMLLARPETARFLSERPGLLGPFVLGLIARLPGIVWSFLFVRGKGGEDAVLV